MSSRPVLVVCLAAAFTTLLDQSSLNTAVPALRSSLGAGPATVSWIIAGYSLTFGLALIPAGRLGDAYGRKWLFVGGVALFTASAVVAATTGHGWVVGRAAGERRAPLTLDPVGLALLAVTALCLLLPFVLPERQAPPWPVWLVVLPVAALAFGGWERRYRGTPILLPALVRSRGFVLGTLVATFQFGSSLALTLYLQDGLGWTPLHAALTTLPSAVGFAVASAVSWRVVGRYGRRSVVLALLASLAGLLATIAILHWAPVALLGAGLTLTQLALGLANGLIISPNQALTLHWAPPGQAGLAAGFLQLAQRISATVGTAAAAGIVLGALTRAGVVTALVICAVQVAVAAALAALDVPVKPARDIRRRPLIPTRHIGMLRSAILAVRK